MINYGPYLLIFFIVFNYVKLELSMTTLVHLIQIAKEICGNKLFKRSFHLL